MKKIVFLIFSILLNQSNLFSQVLGNPIITWDFANGLPEDWQTGIISSNNLAHWEYRGPSTIPNINVGSRGSCAGSYQAINSTSKSNGFMIFDSNYWDDSGTVCGNLGTGPDPAPHNAWMITSSVNLSSYPNAVITFQQQFRHYQTSVTKVEISVNNGAWSDIITNTGSQSPNPQWKSANISSLAGGQSDVRFRFSFIGTYYWWMIDDITVYIPNDNDIKLNWVGYSANPLGQSVIPYSNLQYNKYAVVMIPPFSLRASASNIGANPQTNTSLNVRIIKNGQTQMLNTNSAESLLNPNATSTYEILPIYTNPPENGNYRIFYDMQQAETDEVPSNDKDSLNYSITPYTYSRDRGSMANAYIPTGVYSQLQYEIGNMFQVTSSGKQCHSIQVALAEGTQPGAQIKAYIYAEDMETVIAQTNSYTVNVADLNTNGQEKIVTLHFSSAVALSINSYYFVTAAQVGVTQPVRFARSGNSPSETSFVRFPSVNATFYSTTTPIVRMNIFNNGIISGCTDPAAMNYVSNATASDGSCRYPGCTNVNADNYNPNANFDNGTCVIAGCTNPLADNYNPNANQDNGSCIYYGCTNQSADNYDPLANTDDGSCVYSGCTNPLASNYDPQATIDDGSCIVLGCTEPEADNYNPNANQEDGSCIYYGCTDIEADNYDSEANTNDGSCLYSGCTNPLAVNFDEQANVDDGSCIILGCMDENADNFNSNANEEDGSCVYLGCTDELAVNFDPGANQEDGTCLYLEISMHLSGYSGCAPYTVTVFNQTVIQEGGTCTFTVNDQVIQSDCLSSFSYIFLEAGSYQLKYVYQVGDSVSDSTVTVVVYASPTTPMLNYDVSSFELQCTNCGSNSIQWNYQNELIEEANQNSVSILYEDVYRNGNYSVTITESEHNCSATSEAIFVLQPYFSIDNLVGCSPHEIEITNLTDEVEDMMYNLSFGDGSTTNEFPITLEHIYNDANSYVVTVTATSMQGEGTFSQTVSVNPTIEPLLVHVPDDGLVVCQNCNLFQSVVWNVDGVIFNDFGPHSDGGENYTVTGTTAQGCTDSSTLLLNIISIQRIDESSFAVYPNPANGFVTIEQSQNLLSQLEAYDYTGKMICRNQLNTRKHKLDIQEWTTGVYLIKLSNEDTINTFRLVVAH